MKLKGGLTLTAKCIFIAKCFNFGNLFMLIIFYKLSTVYPMGLQTFLLESH